MDYFTQLVIYNSAAQFLMDLGYLTTVRQNSNPAILTSAPGSLVGAAVILAAGGYCTISECKPDLYWPLRVSPVDCVPKRVNYSGPVSVWN